MTLNNESEKFVTWTIRNFPVELKNEIVGTAKKKGVNTSEFLQTVFYEWEGFKKLKRYDLI